MKLKKRIAKRTTPNGKTISVDPKSKTTLVLKHLQTRKRGITSMDAFEKYNLTRLSSVIHSLRKQGYNIVTLDEYTKDGTKYARYILMGKESA